MANRSGVNTKKLISQVRALGAGGESMVRAIMQSSGDEMVAKAKRNAPKDVGALANSIVKVPSSDQLSFAVEVGMVYGAFVEFGTGAQADVPNELRTEALKFKGYKNGNFDQFLTEIEDWCRRKGIDEGAAYPIAAAILERGLKPRPYLYPALVDTRKTVTTRLKTALQRLVNQNR